jgi:hypothetical protein
MGIGNGVVLLTAGRQRFAGDGNMIKVLIYGLMVWSAQIMAGAGSAEPTPAPGDLAASLVVPKVDRDVTLPSAFHQRDLVETKTGELIEVKMAPVRPELPTALQDLILSGISDEDLPAFFLELAAHFDEAKVNSARFEEIARAKFVVVYNLARQINERLSGVVPGDEAQEAINKQAAEKKAGEFLTSYLTMIEGASEKPHLEVSGLVTLMSMYVQDILTNWDAFNTHYKRHATLVSLRAQREGVVEHLNARLVEAKRCDLAAVKQRCCYAPPTKLCRMGSCLLPLVICRTPIWRNPDQIGVCASTGILAGVFAGELGWAKWAQCATCCRCSCQSAAAAAGWQTCCGLATCAGMFVGGTCLAPRHGA